MAVLESGGSPLEAVVAGVTIVEDDPDDDSVGYGGLPNAEGEVELDACVMEARTGRGGAVAALRYVRHAARVAQCVMEQTPHVFLVGEGALQFALAQGFPREDLLTERSRAAWQKWREGVHPDALRGHTPHHPAAMPGERQTTDDQRATHDGRPTGTVTCLAVDARGDLAGVTSTSGLAFKLPGRVGDSPLIGCGLFVENGVGAAGVTGLGEECLLVAGAHTVVEAMRRGLAPAEAALEALRRVAARHGNDPAALRAFHLQFYAVNKEGEHGAATLWAGASYAIHDGEAVRRLPCVGLLERSRVSREP
jgi:N4-(beta-N-acetylglucosaminyl)-L-asparaginase